MSTINLIAMLCCTTQMTKEVINSLGRKSLPLAPSFENFPTFRGTDFIQFGGREMCQERTGGEDILGFPCILQGSEILTTPVLGSFLP